MFPKTKTSTMIDPFGRSIKYLRLSVTDRCNLRCVYCMPEDLKFLSKEHILSIEELYEVSSAFVELGVRKIRITGGEPLVRSNIGTLLNSIGSLDDLDELTMTSNGILLEKNLPFIISSGIKRINVSLDSLDSNVFNSLTRSNQFNNVIKGLLAAKQAGLKIRLNSLILKDKNNNIMSLVNFAIEQGFDIAFIEEMPLGHINSHKRSETITLSKTIQQIIQQHYRLLPNHTNKVAITGPAQYLHIQGSNSKVGFISPHSNNFCHDCNRVRVTVEGKLLLCLGHDNAIDLRSILRSKSYSRKTLKETIIKALHLKPKAHEFSMAKTHVMRFMNMSGG